jgi:hypothetical protein
MTGLSVWAKISSGAKLPIAAKMTARINEKKFLIPSN